MANKGKGKATIKRRVNPMYRTPQPKSRPKVSFDGTVVNAIDYTSTPTTAVNLGTQRFRVDCSNIDSVAAGVTNITRNYEEYSYLSASMIYEPSTGPSSTEAPARIHIGYITSPEKYANWLAGTDATKLSIIRGLRNAKTYNAWERFTYNIPLTHRRKWFDVNTTAGEGVDELDRSCQGAIVVAVESVAAIVSTGHGIWRKICVIKLQGLDTNTIT